MIFDANITILDFGPYIAFQYNFSWNDGQEFRNMNISTLTFKSVFEKFQHVIDENMEKNASSFKDRIAVSMKKDFLQDIYQHVSYDYQDSSGNLNDIFLKLSINCKFS